MDITSDSDDEATKDNSDVLPFVECLSKAAAFKDSGNVAFKNKDLTLAQKCYQDGIDLLMPHKDLGGPSDDVTEEQYASMISTYVGVQGNLGLLHFKQEEWTSVVKSTVEVLKYDGDNVKAHYRRGVAHRRLNSLHESKQALSRAVELDPSNTPAKKELAAVAKEIKEQKQKEKSALAGAFSSGSMYNDKEKERELKLKRAREAEEKLQDDYVKSKLKRRQEGKDEQTFEEYKEEMKKEEEARRKEQEEEKKKRAPPVSKASKKTPVKKTPEEEEEYDEEEQKILKEAKSKGYCYFKNKLDDETSQLIGDITPKATQQAVPEVLASTPSSKVEASSWNHAGTWEERDVTSITKTRLTETCLGTAISLEGGLEDSSLNDTLATLQPPDGSSGDPAALTKSLERMTNMMSKVRGSITEVKKLDGEAQIVMVGQGKKRQIYDFNLTLKFEVTVEDISGDSTKNKTYKGSFDIMDVTPGASYEHKTSFKKAGVSDKVDKAVTELRDRALSRIHSFFANDYLNL
jgi:tetratricopeptide (TPR) repeat protein